MPRSSPRIEGGEGEACVRTTPSSAVIGYRLVDDALILTVTHLEVQVGGYAFGIDKLEVVLVARARTQGEESRPSVGKRSLLVGCSK
jgi:hypothetical protein